MKVTEILTTLLENKETKAIVKWLFGVELTKGQIDIVESIVYPGENRICISAMTRYGKTFSTAVGILMYVYLNDNKKVYLLAPTNDQAKILRNEVAELIIKSPQIQEIVDDATSGTQRLKKEVSKKRITFKNGCSISTLSAQGSGERIMGKGGDLNIIDESCLIDEEVYNKRIFRMLGDSEDSKLVELSNPWHKRNQFYKHWTMDRFKNIHIGYEQALREGRIDEEFLEEARETLTESEFTVLYESDFPEDTEDTLIKWDFIEQARDSEFCLQAEDVFYGVDPAREGNDLTVVTKVIKTGDMWEVKDVWSWSGEEIGEPITMKSVGKIIDIVRNRDDEIRVDEVGVGGGVVDRLNEQGFNVRGFKANKTPEEDKHRFRDRKAEQYFHLKELFEDGNIDLLHHKDLEHQLNTIKYEFTSRGKIKINDNQSKSPDFADSLALATLKKEIEPYYGPL